LRYGEAKALGVGLAFFIWIAALALAKEHAAPIVGAVVLCGIILASFAREYWLRRLGTILAACGMYGLLWLSIILSIFGPATHIEVVLVWIVILVSGVSLWAWKKRPKNRNHTRIPNRNYTGISMPYDLRSYTGIPITVRYAGRCIHCSKWIDPEEKALWKKGVGIWHETCP
jgi:hypothetical protein